MSLVIFSAEGAKRTLEAHSGKLGLPWAFVKDKVFKAVDFLRAENVFLVSAEDPDMINTVQRAFQEGKNLELNVASRQVKVLNKDAAKKLLTGLATAKFGPLWQKHETAINKAFDAFYVYNIFVAACDVQAGAFVREHTKSTNVYLRTKQPAQPVGESLNA